MARNTGIVCRYLWKYQIAAPDTELALEIALWHDSLEVLTGDVPGHFKRQYPDVKAALGEAEDEMILNLPDRNLVDAHFRAIMMMAQDKGLIETQIVKYVDVLDIAIYAGQEKRLGNTLMEEPWKLSREWLAQMDWPWLKELEECLRRT